MRSLPGALTGLCAVQRDRRGRAGDKGPDGNLAAACAACVLVREGKKRWAMRGREKSRGWRGARRELALSSRCQWPRDKCGGFFPIAACMEKRNEMDWFEGEEMGR